MTGRVLHLLSQRPSRTGSGVTLDALVRHAAAAGWDQHVAVGTPAEDEHPAVGELPASRVHPLVFGAGQLDFPLPGMSDVMPYETTRFADLTDDQLSAYRAAWREHVATLVDRHRPDVIHAHHLWILAALVKDATPDTPLVIHGHATGLRQMRLCPALADGVRAGCARADGWLALHRPMADAMVQALDVQPERVHIVGAGYREDVFGPDAAGPHRARARRVVCVGKVSAAKGVPLLLDAFARMADAAPGLELHLVGGWSGDEGAAIAARARSQDGVVVHGIVDQDTLVQLMRGAAVCVLPSLSEGLPLVLVEARACGCRLVATALPGVTEGLAPHLGDDLHLIPMPRLTGVDVIDEADRPRFVADLADALGAALDRPAPATDGTTLAPFTWSAVFARVESVWRTLGGR